MTSEKDVMFWHKNFPLPLGTFVKVRNRVFKEGFYYGQIVASINKRHPKNEIYYCVEIHPMKSQCEMWVRPQTIIRTFRDERELIGDIDEEGLKKAKRLNQ